MAGFSRIYVIGGQGGMWGADGVNPIGCLILVGDANRQWLEPHYFDESLRPIGATRTIVPAGPNHPDALLDASIFFCPRLFKMCPSLAEVEASLRDMDRLDFDARPDKVPAAWQALREEARPFFAQLGIWQADLVPINRE